MTSPTDIRLPVCACRFIAFCYLLDQWRKDPGPPAFLEYSQWPSRVVNNAQSAIAFSLFSLLAWVCVQQTPLAMRRKVSVSFLPVCS
jgi:hypothetical protein